MHKYIGWQRRGFLTEVRGIFESIYNENKAMSIRGTIFFFTKDTKGSLYRVINIIVNTMN